MSKRNRKNKTEAGASQASEAKVQTTAVVEATPNLAQEPEAVLLNIEEAARTHIVGYQTRWLPSIKAFAATHSRGEMHSESEWRSLFSMWGAQLK